MRREDGSTPTVIPALFRYPVIVPAAGGIIFHWIPAFAGKTEQPQPSYRTYSGIQ
jgi:hypothetical protein